MQGTLTHWQYDTFRVAWDDAAIEPASVAFALDAAGKVAQIRMQAISPTVDFSYDYQDLLFEPQVVKYRRTSGGGFSYPRTRPGPTVAWGDITLDVLAASPDDDP